MAVNPPKQDVGVGLWLRKNLFDSWLNGIISLLSFAFLIWLGFGLFRWVFFFATWDRIWVNMKLLAVFRFPSDLLWRPMLVVVLIMGLFGASAGISKLGMGAIIRRAYWWILGFVVACALIALFYWPSVRLWWILAVFISFVGFALGTRFPARIVKGLPWLWGALWFVSIIILIGLPETVESARALHFVDSKLWGGILLTFFLSITGIVVSFPLGIALALGRRSDLPVIKYVCTAFIEIVRGAPLVSWLFIASLLVPLILNANPEPIIRAQIAIILFASAYMAENVRGGLQAIPKGQPEAAHALGLSSWDTMRIIILPQALRAVIPAIVGLFIGLFKDTSLVTIVGLSDLFVVAGQIIPNQPDSLVVTGGVSREAFIAMSFFYWFFSYQMSVASKQLEEQLGLGKR